jgi:hypothetical protein
MEEVRTPGVYVYVRKHGSRYRVTMAGKLFLGHSKPDLIYIGVYPDEETAMKRRAVALANYTKYLSVCDGDRDNFTRLLDVLAPETKSQPRYTGVSCALSKRGFYKFSVSFEGVKYNTLYSNNPRDVNEMVKLNAWIKDNAKDIGISQAIWSARARLKKQKGTGRYGKVNINNITGG